jgi:4'-phosphopantetheinyl transferase
VWAPQPAGTPSLAPGELHVWRADLDLVSASAAALSPAERDRAARIRSDRQRKRWSRSRAILRDLLASYLGREAEVIEFELGPQGKPDVVAGVGPEFNLSHSAGLALFAFTIENPVGIDIQVSGRTRDFLALAERALGQHESQRLSALSAAQRETEFLRSWARHEAALKCRGEGLGAPDPGDELFLLDLDVAEDAAAAAVALERSPETISLWEFEQQLPPA